MAHQAHVYPCFFYMQRLRVFLLLLGCELLVHHRVTPSIKLAVSYLYTWVKRTLPLFCDRLNARVQTFKWELFLIFILVVLFASCGILCKNEIEEFFIVNLYIWHSCLANKPTQLLATCYLQQNR